MAVICGVGLIVGWPVSHLPVVDECGHASGSEPGQVLGTDDTHLMIYVIRRGVHETWDLVEYVRLGETDVRALWKETACWRLPAAATKLLILHDRWPPL